MFKIKTGQNDIELINTTMSSNVDQKKTNDGPN
jgi:hypothetical protein